MSLGQRMILTNIVLSTFPRKEIQSLGRIVSLLFSRLTGPEQAGLKCSVCELRLLPKLRFRILQASLHITE